MINFLEEAQALFEYTRGIRRDLHMHPELGYKEFRTANIVAKELTDLGLEVKTGIAETGVVALLEGKSAGPVILIRFDMDALPIQEETHAEYASENDGVMHACGHDGHVAIGLTVARLLNKHRDEFGGTVKLVFQPAEEGLGGAEKMISEGILENPQPDVVLSHHIWNEQPVGWLGIVPGPLMAAADIFTIKMSGKGGHGALPHLTRDPILASAQVINLLQSIVSRNVSPLKSAVISVAKIRGGDAFNVIPSHVEIKGTIRTFESEIRDLVVQRMKEIVRDIAHALDCSAEINITSITPAIINHADITARVQDVAKNVLSEYEIDTRTMTMVSEDMAFMLQKFPGCFFLVGSANHEKNLNSAHHHPKFDFDESILPKAVALMAAATCEFLSK